MKPTEVRREPGMACPPIRFRLPAAFLDQALQFVVLALQRFGLLPITLSRLRSSDDAHRPTRLRPEEPVEDRYFSSPNLTAAPEAGNHAHRLPAGIDAD
jgi:hypothetical protein